MADTKITALTAITTVDPANDVLPIVDVSDTSMAASGTTKKITTNQILGASGTATLASATITGDLTVDTSTLKVDSANNRVGIGTASPGNALHVQSTGDIARFTNGTNSAYLAIDSAGYTLFTGAGQTGNGFYAKATTNAVQLWTNGAQRYDIDSTGVSTWSVGGSTAMTLNSTGLGVGRSPISKLTVDKASQTPGGTTPNGAFVITDTAGGNLALELGVNSAGSPWIQSRNSTTGAYYDLLINPNGGNVGIGVTPKPWRSGARALQLGANGYVTLNEQANGNANICFAAYEGSANVFNYTTTGDLPSRYVLVSGTHQWYTAPSGTAGNAITWTQAMTLDASGNLLVGTTSLGARNTNIFSKAVGFALEVQQRASPSGGSCLGLTYSVGTPNNTTDYFLYCADATATRAYMQSNGNILNVNGSYGTISDLRLKENISDARNYLADLLKLRVVKYSLKSEASPTANLIGLIAQEVEQVFPTLVETNADDIKSIKTTVLIPMLLKALQELATRVQTLETR